jgi:hypothetical protein
MPKEFREIGTIVWGAGPGTILHPEVSSVAKQEHMLKSA